MNFTPAVHFSNPGFRLLHFKRTKDALGGNALQVWDEYGHHLGNVLKAVVYTYDPEAIILGGSISKAYNFFEASMKQAMADFLFPKPLKS
ncbi:MAG: ROK family protein [Bacteroidales bacterium]